MAIRHFHGAVMWSGMWYGDVGYGMAWPLGIVHGARRMAAFDRVDPAHADRQSSRHSCGSINRLSQSIEGSVISLLYSHFQVDMLIADWIGSADRSVINLPYSHF
jgi:hypothetical protein